MIRWYLDVKGILREMQGKAFDAKSAWESGDKGSAEAFHEYLRKDYSRLQKLWSQNVAGSVPSNLGRHVAWAQENDADDISLRDVPELEEYIDGLLAQSIEDKGEDGVYRLLHPAIVKSSYEQFRNGHFRDAVLNSIVAIFDLIRDLTKLDLDGSDLSNRAFSLDDPYLVLSELKSKSGKNDQKGFMQIFSGSYIGIRNPKAHSLNHDLDEEKAAQYLIHASLLARRVTEARVLKANE